MNSSPSWTPNRGTMRSTYSSGTRRKQLSSQLHDALVWTKNVVRLTSGWWQECSDLKGNFVEVYINNIIVKTPNGETMRPTFWPPSDSWESIIWAWTQRSALLTCATGNFSIACLPIGALSWIPKNTRVSRKWKPTHYQRNTTNN